MLTYLFADDAKLYTHVKSEQGELVLQKILTVLWIGQTNGS